MQESKARQYERLRDQGKSHEEAVAIIEGAAAPKTDTLPAAAPVDRTDQSVRNPDAGLDPAMRGVRGLASFAVGGLAGGVAGNLAARALAKAALPRVVTSMASGAAGGVVGGSAGRGAQAAAEGRNPLPDMMPSAMDAGLGAGVSGAVGLGSWAAKKLGLTPKRIVADKAKEMLTKTASAGGRTPQELLDEVAKAEGRGIAVTDVNPQVRALGRDVAKKSPVAEQVLQDFAESRARVPSQRALADIESALGTKAANLNTTRESLKAALKQADDARFNPLFEAHPDLIDDPETVAQVRAVLKHLSGAKRGLVGEQAVTMHPIDEVLGELGDEGEAVTLKGLHRLKVALNRAAGVPATTSDAAMRTGSFKKAAEQLKGLALKNVRGGAEYGKALAESEADRAVMDALEEGADALSKGVTPDDVVAALDRYKGNPRALEAYRAGLGGTVKNELGQNRSLGLLEPDNVRDKLDALSVSPQAAAQRATKFKDLESIETTNQVQGRVQPPTIEGVDRTAMDGQFGQAGMLGNLVLGRVGSAVAGAALPVGAGVRGLAKGRTGRIERKALEEIARLLTKDAGKSSAQSAKELLERSDVLALLRARRAATTAGAIAGSQNR